MVLSVVDVIAVLTDSTNPATYWRVLKKRLKSEGNETVTNCNGLKLLAEDGKMRMTDVADQEQLFRLIQSIPSPKAEPFKMWMARVASERLDQIQDPELSIQQALADYRRLGYSEEVRSEKDNRYFYGSFAGFAEGLRLAAVDWEDDGDLDCLAGTADGKLMLLRDPKVGRPTNLKALAGVDNVLLTWDPNQQSRIRGYRVYRAAGEGTASVQQQDGGISGFERIAQPQLPTYRDFPPATEDGGSPYAYKVSSVSRFYTAGNSTPTETESMPTEAVTARLGDVRFFWNDVAVKCGEQVDVMLSIENSMNYMISSNTQVVAYDPEYLRPVKVAKTGLTEGCVVVDVVGGRGATALPEGEWQVTITGVSEGGHAGRVTLPAGGGKFLVFVFEALKEGMTTVGGESGATVSIAARSASAPYQLGDVDGDGDVDEADLRLLARLKNGNGQHPSADQLKAGDFNGNGKLDNADYQALKALLKGRGE